MRDKKGEAINGRSVLHLIKITTTFAFTFDAFSQEKQTSIKDIELNPSITRITSIN